MEQFLKNYFTDDDEKLKWQTGKENLLLKTCVFDVVSNHNVLYNNYYYSYIILVLLLFISMNE